MSLVDDFISHLMLERIASNEFVGYSRYSAAKNHIYGGQVLGQALSAANQTVEGRLCHSLSAQFLRAGNLEGAIHFKVANLRDGRNFSVRRVTAKQQGRVLLTLEASFHIEAEGFNLQPKMPEVLPPDSFRTMESYRKAFDELGLHRLYEFLATNSVFDFRCLELPSYLELNNRPAVQRMWMKAKHDVPDDPAMQRSMLAFISDHNFIRTASLPYRNQITSQASQMATLNHTMWIHRPVNLNNWHLYDMHSASCFGDRALVMGHVYAETGELVATMVQEGLLRLLGDGVNAAFSENA
ncbi:acyl-CoA thioesterase [Zhongshania sp. BJYM1]|uniref:acyl-CoA thioesterase n=1 Tax=Zhongshania aquatica TaxID=2965069 RepID=UPI0022B3D38C|nr:acyl-CoA thioesterase domain-containing protein [Marortus sp. BJYM1]